MKDETISHKGEYNIEKQDADDKRVVIEPNPKMDDVQSKFLNQISQKRKNNDSKQQALSMMIHNGKHGSTMPRKMKFDRIPLRHNYK